MKTKLIGLCILSFSFAIIMTISSCKKDEAADLTDTELYIMAKETSGFTWFKNSDIKLDKSIGSGHTEPFLRTRYNAIAATKLGLDGKIIAGTTFPEGSLIVKELYSDASTLTSYAILYKQTNHKNADSNGWVWGYVFVDGSTKVPSADKGSGCISCHTTDGNIDYMLMNKYFP